MHNQWRVTRNEVILAWILAISNRLLLLLHGQRFVIIPLTQFINMASIFLLCDLGNVFKETNRTQGFLISCIAEFQRSCFQVHFENNLELGYVKDTEDRLKFM